MKECKISISKRMQYCIIFFFLLKPDYFSFLGIFTILYNYTFLIILFCVLINEIRKLQIRKIQTRKTQIGKMQIRKTQIRKPT